MSENQDDTILHQDDVEEVINEEIDENVQLGLPAITSPTAPGATYAQAEAASMKTAVDDIIAALVAAGIVLEDV